MGSETKAFGWFFDLHDQFNTLCSRADANILQEPMEYVRNQFLTAGESFVQLCTGLVEDLEQCGITPRRIGESTVLPSREISNVGIDDDHEDISSEEKGDTEMTIVVLENPETETSDSSKTSISSTFSVSDGNDVEGLNIEEVKCGGAHVNSSTSVQCSTFNGYLEETDEIGKYSEALFASKVEEYNLPDNEVTSCSGASSVEETHSCGSGEATQPKGWHELSESLTSVESEEFCSDSDTESDHEFYEKSKTALSVKNLTENNLHETASKSFDAATEADEWEKLDDDECDSDWEIMSETSSDGYVNRGIMMSD